MRKLLYGYSSRLSIVLFLAQQLFLIAACFYSRREGGEMRTILAKHLKSLDDGLEMLIFHPAVTGKQ